MGTSETPEEPWFEKIEEIEEEHIEAITGQVYEHSERIVKYIHHPARVITHQARQISDLPPVPILRLISETHAADKNVHTYQIELTDSRCFSSPVVLEIVVEGDGQIVMEETHE